MARVPLTVRLEALRVTPTPIAHDFADDPLTTVLHQIGQDNYTNVALSQSIVQSSPDEQVIRQRGRRRLTRNWSPPEENKMPPLSGPFQRTPTKLSALSSGMILRSSPRKRLTLGTTAPEPAPLATALAFSPIKQQQRTEGAPPPKRPRLGDEERPIAQTHDAPLATLLQGMSKKQLIEIITGQLLGDQNAEERIRAKLPMPDIEPMKDDLLHAKRNIFKALPTSRLCKKTDSSAYSRAAVHLAEFKRILSGQTKQLYDSNHWDALLDYVTLAWPLVFATPVWDANHHNAVRRQCFKFLACYLIAAVRNGGMRLGVNRLRNLEKHLGDWSKDCEDVLCCVSALNKALMKGRASM